MIHLLDSCVLANSHIASTHITSHRELDSLLGGRDRGRVSESCQVTAHFLELAGRHGHLTIVLGLGDAEVLAVDHHELHLEVRDLLLVGALEHEGHNFGILCGHMGSGGFGVFGGSGVSFVTLCPYASLRPRPHKKQACRHYQVSGCTHVLGLEGDDVVVVSTLQDLGQRGHVHADGHFTVASVMIEAFCLELHGHQRHMRGVHGLQGDARGGAVEVGLRDEVLDGLDELLEQGSLCNACLCREGVCQGCVMKSESARCRKHAAWLGGAPSMLSEYECGETAPF